MRKDFTAPIHYNHALEWEHPLHVKVMTLKVRPNVPAQADLHYALHFGVVLRGKMKISYPDAEFVAGAGQAWFTACWEPHVGAALEDSEIILFTILLETLGSAASFADIPWNSPFLCPADKRPQALSPELREQLSRQGREIAAIVREDAANAEAKCWLRFHELLLPFTRMTEDARQESRKATVFSRVQPALELIRTSRRRVTVEEAARHCGLGRRRFSTLFQQVFGSPFSAFSLRARLAGAVTDLCGGKKPVKLIAADWGFHDSSHFHHAFIAHFGHSPKAFRDLNAP